MGRISWGGGKEWEHIEGIVARLADDTLPQQSFPPRTGEATPLTLSMHWHPGLPPNERDMRSRGGGGWGELCRTQLFPPTSEPNMRGTLTPQSCSFLYHRYVSVFDTFNPVSGREVHPLGGKSSRASSSTTGNRAHTHTHKPYFTSASISRVVITLKLSPSPCTACPLLLLMNESGESTMMIWCIYLVGHPTFDPTMKLSD